MDTSESGLHFTFIFPHSLGNNRLRQNIGVTINVLKPLSGIWLLRENVLRLGDNIKISDVEGTVIKLSFRTTWLRTREGHIVIMSNSTLYNGPFTNLTAKERLSRKFETKNEPLQVHNSY